MSLRGKERDIFGPWDELILQVKTRLNSLSPFFFFGLSFECFLFSLSRTSLGSSFVLMF